MSAPDPLREKLFHAAAELPDPVQRAAYLDAACGGDAQLRADVEDLLRHDAAAGSYLDKPATPGERTIAPETISERPGMTIGPYKLLEQIGEGGMGTVWMAQQTEPVKRVVALKLIKAGMDSKQVIARFEAERQALALMDHPNIARVLDADTTDAGRPYFVMDLVKGVPITRYCDEHHLTPRQRLELFIPVCHAIQHAHQKGVIHRDLKPSNVLVALYDGKPVPKVIDFGVAKAAGQPLTEHTLVTGFGAIVGTLEYMSPEQAEINQLDIDTRSDIYSLGVLLYELLTGSPPFSRKELEKAGMLEMLRVIREEEPSKPSTKLSTAEGLPTLAANRGTEPAKLTKLVRGELDWIVMKALEKDRNRRYETANGFAMDVQRYLADEAVQACPPSVGYRFRKFVRWNKAALAFTGMFMMVLLTLTGGIGWNLRDRAARQAAVEQEVNLALKEAERLQEQAKWPEALSAAKRAEGLLAGGGSDELRDRVYELRKDLEMVLRLDDIRLLASEWKNDKFDHETANRAYAKAFADYGIDVGGLPTDEAAARIRARARVAVVLSAALEDWAYSRSTQDRAGALALTALAQSADPDPWRLKLRQAAKQNDTKALAALSASPELLRQPPTSLLALARAMQARGDVEAEIEVLRQAQRQYAGDFWINFELARALSQRGSSYRDEVVAFYRAALAVRPQSVAALNNLGLALEDLGKLDEAIACYHKAIELETNAVRTLSNLGQALNRQGKGEEAIAACRKAIELDPKFTLGYIRLGIVLFDQNQVDEAIACYRKAIELDSIRIERAWAHRNLGDALRKQGKVDEAIVSYRKAIEIFPTYDSAYNGLGGLLCDDLQEYEKAEACFRKAIDLNPKSVLAHFNLGSALEAQKRLDEAIAAYRKATEFDPKFHYAYRAIVRVLMSQGKQKEAVACCHEAIELDPKNANAHISLGALLCDDLREYEKAEACFRTAIKLDPKHAWAHVCLGNALSAQGKLDEAIAAYRKAIDIEPRVTMGHNNLGFALLRKGNVDEAIDNFRTAIELHPKDPRAYSNLGHVLREHGKLDEAIDAFRTFIELDPKNATGYSNLGVALAGKKKLDEAIENFRTAIKLDPKFANAYFGLGDALRKKGLDDEAAAAYRQAIRLKQDFVAPHYNLFLMLKKQGKLEDAIRSLEKVIELEPKHVFRHHELAWLLATWPDAKFRDPKRAVQLAKKAVELAPKTGLYWVTLGAAHYRAGSLNDAVAALEESMKLRKGGDSNDWFFLAMAHWQLGKKEEARKRFDDAVQWMDKNQPKNEELRRFRAEAAELLGVKEVTK